MKMKWESKFTFIWEACVLAFFVIVTLLSGCKKSNKTEDVRLMERVAKETASIHYKCPVQDIYTRSWSFISDSVDEDRGFFVFNVCGKKRAYRCSDYSCWEVMPR